MLGDLAAHREIGLEGSAEHLALCVVEVERVDDVELEQRMVGEFRIVNPCPHRRLEAPPGQHHCRLAGKRESPERLAAGLQHRLFGKGGEVAIRPSHGQEFIYDLRPGEELYITLIVTIEPDQQRLQEARTRRRRVRASCSRCWAGSMVTIRVMGLNMCVTR